MSTIFQCFRHLCGPHNRHDSFDFNDSPSRRDNGKQKAVTLLMRPEQHSSGMKALYSSSSSGLPQLIDLELSRKKTGDEADKEFWNSTLIEGLVQPENNYAKAFPYHPHLTKVNGKEANTNMPPAELDDLRSRSVQIYVYAPKGYKGKGKEKVVQLDHGAEVSKENIKAQGANLTKEKLDKMSQHLSYREFDFAFTPEYSLQPSVTRSSAAPAEHLQQAKAGSEGRTTLAQNSDNVSTFTLVPGAYPIGIDTLGHSNIPIAYSKSGEDEETSYRPGNARPLEDKPVAPPSSPTTLTWNIALHRILASGFVDPNIIERVQQRQKARGQGSQMNIVEGSLVPNFSRPIIGSQFYDCFTATVMQQAPSSKPQPPLVNGIPGELRNGVLNHTPLAKECKIPIGLPTKEEFRLYAPQPPYSPVLPEVLIKRYEGTIATQAKLIHTLHNIVDGLRERNDDLEERLVPQVAKWLEEKSLALELTEKMVIAMRAEIIDLKIAIDFGNKVLGGCWAREWELWRWLKEIKDKRRSRGSSLLTRLFVGKTKPEGDKGLGLERLPEEYKWETFGHGPDPSGTEDDTEFLNYNTNQEEPRRPQLSCVSSQASGPRTSSASIQRPVLDAVVALAEQNLKILKEDVEEMVVLVQGCKQHSTGI